jgi:hypothetical protein
MHPYAKLLLIAAGSLLVSGGLWAQEAYRSPDRDFLAKLSYDTSGAGRAELAQRVCMAITRDGNYRIVRWFNDPQETTMQFQGKVPRAQLEELRALLGSSEFRTLSGSHVGVIRMQSESFGAEIPKARREDGTQRLRWLNADGESPFPGAMAKVVDWLKHFEPKDGKPFEYAEYPDVCPSVGFRLLQPSVATNSRP